MAALREALGAADPLPPVPAVPPVPPPPARVYSPRPEKSAFAAQAARHTTALLGIGHVGTRYATDVVLQFQAELAVAHAAVGAELPDGWAEANGFVGVHHARDLAPRVPAPPRSRAPARRRRRWPSVRARCQRGADVQLIVADGLSAVACIQTGKQLHDAVAAACQARGLRVGTPVAARFARVWLEDEIGQETGARVAMILLGERPGLGTGDGLSAYVVHEPRIGKTDGDRNMISNIHARGIAARRGRRAARGARGRDDRAADQRRRPSISASSARSPAAAATARRRSGSGWWAMTAGHDPRADRPDRAVGAAAAARRSGADRARTAAIRRATPRSAS